MTMREIPFAPGYQITEDGQVYTPFGLDGRRNGKLRLMTGYDIRGYLKLSLTKNGRPRQYFVHRLVLETFVGPCPPGCQTRHLDGNRMNNHVSNLAWGTSRENHADMRRHGTDQRGERHPRARLTDQQVIHARSRVASGERQADVARSLGVPKVLINHLVKRRTWKHIRSTP